MEIVKECHNKQLHSVYIQAHILSHSGKHTYTCTLHKYTYFHGELYWYNSNNSTVRLSSILRSSRNIFLQIRLNIKYQ